MRTRKVFSVFFTFVLLHAAVSLQGQVPEIGKDRQSVDSADKSMLPVRLSTGVIVETASFVMTVIADAKDPLSCIVSLPEAPGGLKLTRGPVVKPYVPLEDGTRARNEVEISFTFRADSAGRYVLASFPVTTDAGAFTTEPVLIEVGLRKNPSVVPYDVRWRIPEGAVYEGQTIPLVLELYNLKEIVFPDSLQVSSPASGMFEEAGSIGDIRSDPVGAVTLYTVPVATYLFTPTQRGEVLIPPAQTVLQGITRKSPAYSLKILPVPQEIRSSGAVGAFTVESRIERGSLFTGGKIALHLIVAGHGNLGYLQFPTPESSSLISTEKLESGSIFPSEAGYSGHRETVFMFHAEKPGSYSIRIPQFRWFDPADGVVKYSEEKKFTVEVLPETGGASGEPDPFPFRILNARTAADLQSSDLSGKPALYLLYLPGPVVFLGYVVFRKKTIGKRRRGLSSVLLILLVLPLAGSSPFPFDDFNAGSASYESGRYEEAFASFGRAAALAPDNAGIRFNLFAASWHLGRYGEAVLALRKAVFLKPMNGNFRSALEWAEAKLDTGRQAPVAPAVHSDILFLGSILFVNLSCLFAGLLLNRRKGLYSILFVLLLFGAAGTSGTFLYARSVRLENTAVVGPEAGSLRKIPRAASSEWFPLKAGTAVRILAGSDEFLLIETGFGIQGWIPGNNLLLENDNGFW